QRLAYAPPEKAQQIRDEIRRLDQGDPADSANNSRTQNPLSPTTAEASAVYDPFLVSKSTISYSAQGAELSDAAITDTEGRPCNILKHGETYRYRYTTTFEKTAFMVRFGMMIKTVSGVELAGCATHPKGDGFEIVEKGQRMMVEFEFRNLLAPGTYFLNAGVLGRVNEEITWLHRMLDVVMFRVLPEPGQIFTGMINLMPADHYRVLDVHPCEETETAESL
ncbi:MAG TPA: Wzt carbohydrate-binding domain-containing protein, partial [Tepidisphaeraceae bacterium]|nr:Wzt carbohydrate-binding domain-containing protein [Tepidisphaeraceae bacterium]